MKTDKKILDRLEELISKGVTMRESSRINAGKQDLRGAKVDRESVFGWATSCLNILRIVFGEGSPHYKTFESLHGSIEAYVNFVKCLGIIKSAKDDYESGFSQEIRELITADVFDDFLEQAEHLLAENYKGPSAVVVGCVLEDTLRKLCAKSGIALSARPKLDIMNADLVKKGVYNKLKQKSIIMWADLRNKAAHGKWTEFTDGDVEDMLRGVRRFVTDHPVS